MVLTLIYLAVIVYFSVLDGSMIKKIEPKNLRNAYGILVFVIVMVSIFTILTTTNESDFAILLCLNIIVCAGIYVQCKYNEKTTNLEIERKFVVELDLEILENWDMKKISQFYVKSPSDEMEIRFRNSNDEYYITVKKGSGLVRKEYERQINKDIFDRMEKNAVGNIIKKKRFCKSGLEIDIYESPVFKFAILEKEFANEFAASKFKCPKFISIVKEVTMDKRFKNKQLSKNGFPTDF